MSVLTAPDTTRLDASDDKPLHLCQVLEEEFVNLHGPLPEDYPVSASEEERLEAIFTLIHGLDRKRTALCLSGGGIRSATFALGVLQGLARCNFLQQFDFLSTVSGGGYIGSWLSAWIHRHPQGIEGVTQALKTAQSSRLNPEPAPIHHLRAYSNYLSPQSGLFSADTWTLVATYLRNLTLNWLVMVPLLVAVLTVPRLFIALTRTPPSPWATLGALVVGIFLAVLAIAYVGVSRPSVNYHRSGRRSFLKWCLLPLVGSATALAIFWYWIDGRSSGLGGDGLGGDSPDSETLDLWTFVLFGVMVRLAGWLVYSGVVRRRRALRELPVALAAGAVGGALFWVVAVGIFSRPASQPELYACFAVPLLLAAFAATGTIFIGLTSHSTNDEDPEWWARFGGWILITGVTWAMVSGVVIFGPMALLALPELLPGLVLSLGSLSGAAVVMAGGSAKTPGAAQSSALPAGFQARILELAQVLAAPVFTVFLITALSLGTNWLLAPLVVTATGMPSDPLGHLQIIRESGLGALALVVTALIAFGVVLALFVNINKLSLHSMYRNRLTRAYIGASRTDRDPNPFTGFDEADDLSMHEIRPQSPAERPLHIVNITLNVVSGSRRDWQQRKAESFTISPLHSGSRSMGYRPSARYGGQGGISLGTAMAISGAAASPNVGYNSSPFITFLMALFNARLGWWLGNPGEIGKDTYRAAGPLLAVSPLIQEAFGLIDERSKYVFLSDGGHYENLGLYEMVLRRCHFIVVSDAGRDQDYTFESLGNAIRKIRIDLGISIDFEDIPIYSKQKGAKGEYCAIGTIRYSEVDGPGTDGILIYIKPAIYGTEPTDVYHYAQENRDFPQEPTSDQWFSEAQFESYRMLGLHAISRVWDPAKPCVSMEDLVGQIKDRLARRNGKGAVRRDGTQRRTRIAARPTLRRGPTRATLEPTRRPPSSVEHTPSHHAS